MSLGRNILVWLARHALALLLILLILIAARYLLPPAWTWLRAQAEAARGVPAAQSAYAEARRAFEAYAERRAAEAEAATAALPEAPDTALRQRRAAIPPAIEALRGARLSGARLALAAARGDSDRIFAHYRAGAEIALLEREARYIDALLAVRAAAGGREAELAARREEAVRRLHASHAAWQAANARVQQLNQRPLAGARNFLCRNARPGVGCDNYRALAAALAEREAALAANREALRTIRDIDRASRGAATARAAAQDASASFAAQRAEIEGQAEALERRAGENWLLWIRKPVLETLPTALLILAVAIFGPALLKAFLYFLVAPLAARRPPIRLVAHERGEAALEPGGPAVSQQVRLEPGGELLVVPEAVQSTPHHAAKATKWLLRWSMPLSSLAAGMVALIRIRSTKPDFVLVSATRNPLSEVAILSLPEGSAMVLRPRALRGMVQPVDRPLSITRHWRLGHLSAWLTLQFRYLVFHGPCRLIVEGTRGVRLEPAARGRGINQAATIGFSAGLAYSVRRSEAFGAYLIGKQELFNDSFADGAGYYLYEEMPREGAGGGLWGRGLRGLGDAFLKIFGI